MERIISLGIGGISSLTYKIGMCHCTLESRLSMICIQVWLVILN
jgi:hypothetical protein